MTDAVPMIPEERRQEILRLLRSSGVLSIRTLTNLMNVSHMTVRRDIAMLEEAGEVASVAGGVRLAGWTGARPPRERSARATIEILPKRAIARLAAELVKSDMVVFLDAGTTCQFVVPLLAEKTGLTVVTNDFHTVLSLFDYPEIETIHTGGLVDPSSGSAAGPIAAESVRQVSIDLAFLSTGAWDLRHGITSPAQEKVELKRAVIASSSMSILLADSTKWGTFERFRVAELSQLDGVITDTELPMDVRSAIEGTGAAVSVASFSS